MFFEVTGHGGERYSAYYNELNEVCYIYDNYYHVIDEGKKEGKLIKGAYGIYIII